MFDGLGILAGRASDALVVVYWKKSRTEAFIRRLQILVLLD